VKRLLFLAALPLLLAWKNAEPGYPWQFPKDHWAHPDYRNEWWYFTGQLETNANPPRRFGYQFTLFRIGLTQAPAGQGSAWKSKQLLMGHAALSDLQTGKHYFHDVLVRESPLLGVCFPPPPSPLSPSAVCWASAPTGTEGRWKVDWNGTAFRFQAVTADFSFDLTTTPEKPLIFQGPGGLSRKTADGSSASLYYSFTRLKTTGTLTFPPSPLSSVRGLSWMDKEFGSGALGASQVGWDWFSLQLNDGRELMLYLLRKADGTLDHASGTLVEKSGQVRYLTAEDFTLKALGKWKSPHTQAVYPAGWDLQFSPLTTLASLRISPLVPDSENISQRVDGIAYWEGAVQILDTEKKVIGQGYVELTGYAGSVQHIQVH